MNDEHFPSDLMTPNEASEILHVHSATVRQWLLHGKLPGFRVGGRWLVSKADVLAAIKRYVPESGQPKTVSELRAEAERIDAELRLARIRR